MGAQRREEQVHPGMSGTFRQRPETRRAFQAEELWRYRDMKW